MKNLIFAIVFLLSVVIGGCKKDAPTIQQRLIGKWSYIKMVEKIYNNPETTSPSDGKTYYEFKNNAELIITNGNGNQSSKKWEIVNNQKLRLDNQDPKFDNTISTIDQHNLVYFMEIQDANGTYKATYYFSK